MFSLSTAFQRSAPSQGGRPPSPQEMPSEMPRERPSSLPSETWTPERVEQLERGYHAGRSCAKIAEEIGVTRNAVIGKLNRLGLKRPRDVIREQLARARAARRKDLKSSSKVNIGRLLRSKRSQQSMPPLAFCEPIPSVDIIPINNGHGPSLLELGPSQCHWPFGTPGANDFCYCGHESLEGFSYCLGHASIAYRNSRRPRNSASSVSR